MKTLNGIDNTEALGILKGKKLGLITNPTGMNAHLRSTAEILKADYDLRVVYGPEHGIRGDQQAGIGVPQPDFDHELGVRCFSLYGKTRRPTPEMLDDIEMMVYDIQDVGARFYTYIYTLAYAMEECAKAGIPVTVLDRVNPLGGDIVEGILLNPALHSFVGEYPIPTRYGLTVGEYARHINDTQHLGCELHIVPCLGWHRDMLYDETRLPWIMPSPTSPRLKLHWSISAPVSLRGPISPKGAAPPTHSSSSAPPSWTPHAWQKSSMPSSSLAFSGVQHISRPHSANTKASSATAYSSTSWTETISAPLRQVSASLTPFGANTPTSK